MRYQRSKLKFEAGEPRAASWTVARKPVTGTEFVYAVTDGNHAQRNRWLFVVRVPKSRNEYIEVRPTQVPNDRAYADLDRRALLFRRATMRGYTRFRYCPIGLPLTDGEGNKRVARRGERASLPYFVRALGWRLRLKQTVRCIRGPDPNHQVALVRLNDHRGMIAVYMATKAWVRKWSGSR